MRANDPILAAVLVLGLSGFARCGSGESSRSWKLVWEDTFDGPTGQSPDPTRWTYDVGTGVNGWGNGQLEFDTSRPQNVSLDGEGHLAITALKEDYQGSAYTSARILTRGLFEQEHGRFEARLQLPAGQGLWPAFWLLGSNIDEVSWPACGEIDVMEFRGQLPGQISGSLHGPGYSGGAAVTGVHDLPPGETFADGFHDFAVEWDAKKIVWEVDGDRWQVATRARLPPGSPWAFNHPFFLILNLAVGGGFVGPPSSSTPFPARMLVDHVRVYEAE